MSLTKNFLFMVRDSSVLLHSLAEMESGNTHLVQNFMEYQLDEIIIAALNFKDEFTAKKQCQTMEFLKQIKAYRAEHPRDPNMQINPPNFSEYYTEFDPSYAKRADLILEAIH
jgi:F0F1-type ATP synthase gamma subunit